MTTIVAHVTRGTGTILTAAIYNFDHQNHISNANSLNADKLETVDGIIELSAIGFREPLTAARTYFVRSDGNDNNTGLTDSAGGAFLTVQKAIDVVYGTLDLKGFNVDIQVRDGTFARAIVTSPQVGKGDITLRGNSGTPANVTLTATAIGSENGVIDVRNYAVLFIRDFTITTVTSGSGIFARAGGVVYYTNIRFGATANYQIFATSQSFIQALGDYAIVGSAQRHIWANAHSEVRVQNRTVTLSGTPAFTQFATADYHGLGTLNGNTWTGAATGPRFSVSNNGIIVVAAGLATLPGDAAGTFASGGLYDELGYTFTQKIKKANQSRTNNTLAVDDTLQFAMLASTAYAFRGKVFFTTAVTPDFEFRMLGPAAPTLVSITRKTIAPGALTTMNSASVVAYDAADVTLTGGTTGGYIEFDGVIHNGVNAGNFEFHWAQGTTDATAATVLAGSYIEFRRVDF